jgi:hypothetical protein
VKPGHWTPGFEEIHFRERLVAAAAASMREDAGSVTEKASPLHIISCDDPDDYRRETVNGAICQISPLSPGNGFFRVSFATTGPNDPPTVTLRAKGVELAKAETVLAASTADRDMPLRYFLAMFIFFTIVSTAGW